MSALVQTFRSTPPKHDLYDDFQRAVGKEEGPYKLIKLFKHSFQWLEVLSPRYAFIGKRFSATFIEKGLFFCNRGIDGTIVPKIFGTIQFVRSTAKAVFKSPTALNVWDFSRQAFEFISDISIIMIIALGSLQAIATCAALSLVTDVMDFRDAVVDLETQTARLDAIYWGKKEVVPLEGCRHALLNLVKVVTSLITSLVTISAMYYGIQFNTVAVLSFATTSTIFSIAKKTYKEGMTHNLYKKA